jgi:uncharacterized protein (DUF2336 family)
MFAQHSDEVTHLLVREKEERTLAVRCRNEGARDSHIMLAERYADQAWSLSEVHDEAPYIPSKLWRTAA